MFDNSNEMSLQRRNQSVAILLCCQTISKNDAIWYIESKFGALRFHLVLSDFIWYFLALFGVW